MSGIGKRIGEALWKHLPGDCLSVPVVLAGRDEVVAGRVLSSVVSGPIRDVNLKCGIRVATAVTFVCRWHVATPLETASQSAHHAHPRRWTTSALDLEDLDNTSHRVRPSVRPCLRGMQSSDASFGAKPTFSFLRALDPPSILGAPLNATPRV
ncbi:hypothetical protein C8F01DRAFT_1252920 [Mycena amicta]|nr:hypothetical protein C8F01DRAFT_1252920 [Mycena amicta]